MAQVLIPGLLHENWTLLRTWFYLLLLNVSYRANNLRTTCCLYLIQQVYLVTNHDLHYQRLWKDREGQVRRFSLNCPMPPACMQWGVCVWTVGYWVVLVQVIHCSKSGWVLFFNKNQRHPWEEIMSYSHSRKPDLPVTRSSPLRTWLSILLFFSPPLKPRCQGRVMGFVGGGDNIAIATALPPSSFVHCIVNIK